jgi:phenylpropionate dioxygenase-like ring-hydroxylating dioxygenase large terminal subunit
MHTLIPAHCFTSDEIFSREKSVFGQGVWQLVGTTVELHDHHDFVRRDIGGIPVVVQNFNGRLRAFHNVCSHRFAPIQTDPCGNRKLTCAYHGWTYDEHGVPLGVPHNEKWYGLDRAQKECLALRQFQLEQCGKFVFVKIERGGPTLREFLGEWFEFFERMSNSFGSSLFKTEIDTKCNWKLLVENGFDDTHVEFVHPETIGLVEFTGSEWKGDARDAAEVLLKDNEDHFGVPQLHHALRHSAAFIDMSDRQVASFESFYEPIFPDRPLRSRQYLHVNLFPNVIITSLMGYYYVVLNFEPKSVSETVIHFSVLPTSRSEDAPPLPHDFLHHLGLASLRTYSEDIAMQERLQSMGQSVERPGIFGIREDKMKAFEAAYLCAMGMNLVTAA